MEIDLDSFRYRKMVMFPGFMAGMDVTVGLVGDGLRQVDLDGGGGVVQVFTLTREVTDVLIEIWNEWRNDYKMLGFIYGLLGSTIATVVFFGVV